jgi:hypothetical protein
MAHQNITIQTKSKQSDQYAWDDGMVKTTASQVIEEPDKKFINAAEKIKIHNIPSAMDGISLNGQGNLIHLYMTGDSSETVTKTITYINELHNTEPATEDGTNIYILFINGHSRPSMILKFEGGTSYPVKYFGNTNSLLFERIVANTIIEFQFHNNAWNIIGALDAISLINEKVLSNAPIVPGSGAKISYDAKGLVIGSEQLVEADIPMIPISKVSGLVQVIDELKDTTVIDNIITQLNTKITANGNIEAKTATKISYDNKGLVTGGSDLIESDIPIIPISKVQNLQESLNTKINKRTPIDPGVGTKIVYNSDGLVTGKYDLLATDIPLLDINKIVNLQTILDNKVTANANIIAKTAAKISYDAKGLVTGGQDLNIDDIPTLPTSKITGLDNALANVASASTVTELQSQMIDKLDKNVDIIAGTATKITYDVKGLITGGSALSIIDIPEIPISKVTGLIAALDAAGSESSIEDIRTQLNNKLDKNIDIMSGTGTKLSYDSKGLITGKSDLVVTDIPQLSIDKISNLQDIIDTKLNRNNEISSGTATKITYDVNGLITNGSLLTAADIPTIEIIQVNQLQDILNQKALDSALTDLDTRVTDSLSTMDISLSQKMTGNVAITPGTATKLTYDEKGLIVEGLLLTADDIPSLPILKINTLQDALDSKAPMSHAISDDRYGIATAFVYGHVRAGDVILAPGEPSTGTDNGRYARADHVHPLQVNITGDAATVNGFTIDQNLQTTDTPSFNSINVGSEINIGSNGGVFSRNLTDIPVSMINMVGDNVQVGSGDADLILNGNGVKLKSGQQVATIDQIPAELTGTVTSHRHDLDIPNMTIINATIANTTLKLQLSMTEPSGVIAANTLYGVYA